MQISQEYAAAPGVQQIGDILGLHESEMKLVFGVQELDHRDSIGRVLQMNDIVTCIQVPLKFFVSNGSPGGGSRCASISLEPYEENGRFEAEREQAHRQREHLELEPHELEPTSNEALEVRDVSIICDELNKEKFDPLCKRGRTISRRRASR